MTKTRLAKFNASATDKALISKIADRAMVMYADQPQGKPVKLNLMMDVEACHCNGNPLRLADMLAADDFNFAHDVSGISNCINRTTGKLEGFFSPRFSRRR